MLLLHICCGPCSLMVVKHLREVQIPFKGFFYNPNIHPLQEYLARRDAVSQVAKVLGFEVHYQDAYELEDFLLRILLNPKRPKRCEFCYSLRLTKTAQMAKELGFKAISTTLLFSPYQGHELIRDIGEEVAKQFNLEFYYQDYRRFYWEGKKMALKLDIYRQKYCGCILSERERFLTALQKREKGIKV